MDSMLLITPSGPLVEVDRFRRRREHVGVAVGGVARLVAERGEVRAVRVRQTVEEHRSSGVAGQLVDDARVHRASLAEPCHAGYGIVGVAAAGMIAL